MNSRLASPVRTASDVDSRMFQPHWPGGTKHLLGTAPVARGMTRERSAAAFWSFAHHTNIAVLFIRVRAISGDLRECSRDFSPKPKKIALNQVSLLGLRGGFVLAEANVAELDVHLESGCPLPDQLREMLLAPPQREDVIGATNHCEGRAPFVQPSRRRGSKCDP